MFNFHKGHTLDRTKQRLTEIVYIVWFYYCNGYHLFFVTGKLERKRGEDL